MLQDQSLKLSFPHDEILDRSVPAARTMKELIDYIGAETMFYETWGYKSGDIVRHFDDTYFTMQDRLTSGYSLMSKNVAPSSISPVGQAWRVAYPEFKNQLYQWDGQHPSKLGTYLAACVFYGKIHGASPRGLRYRSKQVSKAQAARVQAIAAQVLGL